MNDLDVLRAFGAELDAADAPKTAGAPPRLRHRIVTGITDDGDEPSTVVGRVRPRTPLANLAALATTAAVVALAIVLAVTGQPAAARRTADQPAPGTTTDARDVLLGADDAARDERVTPPPGEGWIYTRTITLDVDWAARGRYESGTELWWSVAGDEGVWSFDRTGRKPYVTCEASQRAECTIAPGFVTELPDDPAAVFDLLKAPDQVTGLTVSGTGVPNEFGMAWDALLSRRALAPAARVALYEALATLPDLTITRDVTAADGSVGTAIGQRAEAPDDAGRMVAKRGELIFDADTHALLGWRSVYDTGDAERGIPAGAVMQNVANLAQEAGSERWARPDGTIARNGSAREEHAWESSSTPPGPRWKVPTLGTGPDAELAPDGPPVEQASAVPAEG